MKKGAFEVDLIFMIIEILFALAVILIFFTSVYETEPSRYNDINHKLSQQTLAYGKNLFQDIHQLDNNLRSPDSEAKEFSL